MLDIKYMLAKVIGRIKRDREQETIMKFFRKHGIRIGEGARIYSNILTSESYLIKIGNNVTISNDVSFVTHDNSIKKVLSDATDLFGEIIIGNNCFIGSHAMVLYGVELADNVIVAAGSVVTNSIRQNNVIVGGNPAKVISTWDEYAKKSKDNAWDLRKIDRKDLEKRLTRGERLVNRK